VVTVVAKPHQSIGESFARPFALNHQSNASGFSDGRVRRFGRAEEHISGFEEVVDYAAVHLSADRNAALELKKEFICLVVVVVFAGIRASDHHDDIVLRIGAEILVSYRWDKFMSVFFEPALEVEGC
jgi:hypothetical protein